ncbi:MAG: type III pantothenate kinase [Ignavibacteriae bacterium]|nr:MAG: type III pantothenate kinase [Ignavibacteriota bacterium]
MILAIDIGNTNTHFTLFSNDKIIKRLVIDDDVIEQERNFNRSVASFVRYNITHIGIASVVPALIRPVFHWSIRKFNIKPLNINNKVKLPINLKVKSPVTLGADRICNAVAAFELNRKKKEPVIVVDLGTAITYDVVLRNGNFVGGAIAPGMNLLNTALYDYTAQLPLLDKKELKVPDNPIGKNTNKALQSGIVLTVIDAVNGMVARINKQLKKQCKVIVTGSYANIVTEYMDHKAELRENLVSEGIYHIVKYNYGI